MGFGQAMAKYFRAFTNYLLGRDFEAPHRRPGPRLADAVEDARREWIAAKNLFNQVKEPELIDYAVFSIGAAEKRYMYLLAEARRQGVAVDPLTGGRE